MGFSSDLLFLRCLSQEVDPTWSVSADIATANTLSNTSRMTYLIRRNVEAPACTDTRGVTRLGRRHSYVFFSTCLQLVAFPLNCDASKDGGKGLVDFTESILVSRDDTAASDPGEDRPLADHFLKPSTEPE